MEQIFRTLKKRWNHLNTRRVGDYYGIVVDDIDCPLSNLRFADDVLLLATSKRDVGRMIVDLETEASKFGLKVHMGKTVVLTNSEVRPATVRCGGKDVRALQKGEAEKYLGRRLCFDDYHGVEFDHRMAAGWASFCAQKEVLCNHRVSLRDRMKLFNVTVTPAALYASATWTLSAEQERRLRTTQRKMLRKMVGAGRSPEESWVDYIQRATRACVSLAQRHGVEDWADVFWRSKLKIAVKTTNVQDGRWNARLASWKPWFRVHAKRSVGGQHKRWCD